MPMDGIISRVRSHAAALPHLPRRRSTLVTLPPISSNSSSCSSDKLSFKSSEKYLSHSAPGNTGDLRNLAIENVDRRHTVIQLELASAHFESKMVSGQTCDADEPEYSKASAWDEFVTSEARKRATVKKGRRTLKNQLEALGTYMDRRSSLRKDAPFPPVLKDMRKSELHRFEILHKQVAPSPREKGPARRRSVVKVAASASTSTGASEMSRRRSVAVLPPVIRAQIPGAQINESELERGAATRRNSLALPRRPSLRPNGQAARRTSMSLNGGLDAGRW